jgi:hypothetical protein
LFTQKCFILQKIATQHEIGNWFAF